MIASMCVYVCMCMCVSVRACIRACAYVCVHARSYVFNECDHTHVHVLCVFSTANTLLLCINLRTYVPAYVL